MASRSGPKGMDRALQSKVLSKYDSNSEAEIREWIKELIGDEIGTGAYEVEKSLRSGVILVKLIQKLVEGTPPGNLPAEAQTLKLKFNSTTTPFKQMENIETFLKGCKAYGVPDNSCFQTVDLFEGRNMAMVVATILQVGTEAQKHNFNGPTIGPKPHEGHAVDFDPEVLNAGQGIIGLQMGSNKFASQKGMVMGGVRHVADIRCDDINPESQKDINLQSGTNKFASQKGMVIGGVRHIADIRCDDMTQDSQGHIWLQSGSNQFANQKGMSFGAVRHVNDIKSERICDEGKSVINLQYGYTSGANQSGMCFGKNRPILR